MLKYSSERYDCPNCPNEWICCYDVYYESTDKEVIYKMMTYQEIMSYLWNLDTDIEELAPKLDALIQSIRDKENSIRFNDSHIDRSDMQVVDYPSSVFMNIFLKIAEELESAKKQIKNAGSSIEDLYGCLDEVTSAQHQIIVNIEKHNKEHLPEKTADADCIHCWAEMPSFSLTHTGS